MGTYIIAEAGVNHNGSIKLAHELVDAAADAGVDAIKFQTFKASEMITKSAAKADYQKLNDNTDETQFKMLERLELSQAQHYQLKMHAEERGIDFLSTAFDMESLEFLISALGLTTIKVSSGELTNHPFLLEHALSGVKIILSTGMATIDEIEDALGVLAFGFLFRFRNSVTPSINEFKKAYELTEGKEVLKERVTLLHCTSEYPTPLENVNLNSMKTLNDKFGVSVGYSDHTLGTEVASLAIACGAQVLEKHFTLDKALAGPDHAMSLSPDKLKEYVDAAKSAEVIMGSYEKDPTKGELENRKIGRKVIVALKDINKGEILSNSNVGLKRSKDKGYDPSLYWDIVGSKAKEDIQVDSAITSLLVDTEQDN